MSEENKKPTPDKLPEVEIDTSKPTADGDGAAVVQKGKFARWLENFFYHYKWHTAAVAFILIVAIVCTVTMCGREKADLHIVYAGGMDISQNRDGSDRSEHEKFLAALTNFAKDYNKDKKKTVDLETFYWLSTAEIAALNSDQDDENNVNQAMQSSIAQGFEDIDRLMTFKASSQYYVWFISPALYDQYVSTVKKSGGDATTLFASLDSFTAGKPESIFYDSSHTAIKLSTLRIYQDTELHMLPEDTLIILRAHGGVGNKTSKKAFEASRDYFNTIVNY